MKWLAECSVTALREALQAVAPELGTCSITIPQPVAAAQADPLWWSSSAVLDGAVPGERFIAKFAWSHPAAIRLAHEIGVLTALTREPEVPFLPEVVASSTDPLLLVTRFVPGTSLFEVVDSIDRDHAGQQLARFLAALHQPAARARAETAIGRLSGTRVPPATTRALRDRFGTWIRPVQHRTVVRWCDWADAVLVTPGPAVLVHGDLHGNNQVWDHGELRLVVDFESIGAAEPEYDLRTFPGPGMGPGVELLTATMGHYQQITGHQLSADRVMAWHVRTALGDALWRSEAGIHLADHRTPPEWVDDLAARFSALGINPGMPRQLQSLFHPAFASRACNTWMALAIYSGRRKKHGMNHAQREPPLQGVDGERSPARILVMALSNTSSRLWGPSEVGASASAAAR